MEFIIIFLISLGVLFLGLIVVGLFVIKNIRDKNKVRFNIILKGNGIYKKKVPKKKLSKTMTINGGVYNFDSDCLIKNKFVDDIFYYDNNPDPINFNNKNRTPETYNSRDLKSLMDSDLIEKLFNEKKIDKIEMVMYILLVISSLTVVGLILSFIFPASIVGSGNEEFIKGVVKDVLVNG